MAAQLVTMADFARLKGVSRKTVTVWVQRGRVPTVLQGSRAMIDPVAAERALQDTTQRIAAVAAAVDADSDDDDAGYLLDVSAPAPATRREDSLTSLKAETERQRGRLLELNRLEREGALIDRAQVETEQEVAARLVRQALDQLPSRAEDIYAAGQANGVKGVRAALKGLVRNAEDALARSIVEAAERIEFERAQTDDADVAA